MVAFHFPPIQASSGVHRTVGFARGLQTAGWQTTVLTVTRNALPSYIDHNHAMIPDGVRVIRAPAIDAVRTLSRRGKYFDFTAIPDRWTSWIATGVAMGLTRILTHRPDVLFSTFPIASAHIIAGVLNRLTGIPWFADFRDPMAQDEYPKDERVWRSYRAIEERTMRAASRLIFTAPGAVEYYGARYPDHIREKGCLIENGYDELLFSEVEAQRLLGGSDDVENGTGAGPLTLLHSGLLYPWERDPSSFFAALSQLKAAGEISKGSLRIVFRAASHEASFTNDLQRLDIEDLIEFRPPTDYHAALAEMAQADALLVMQAANSNFQIPAKTYEYLRIGKPIVGLLDDAGDTAALLRSGGSNWNAQIDSPEAIMALLRELLHAHAERRLQSAVPDAFVQKASRTCRAEELVKLLRDCSLGV
jgi:hypothetical protein